MAAPGECCPQQHKRRSYRRVDWSFDFAIELSVIPDSFDGPSPTSRLRYREYRLRAIRSILISRIFSGAAPIRTPHDMSPGWFKESNRGNSDTVVFLPHLNNRFVYRTIRSGLGQGVIVSPLIIFFLRMTPVRADLVERHLPPLSVGR